MHIFISKGREVIYCLLVIVFFFVLLPASAQCDDWIIYDENPYGQFLYNKTSVSKNHDGLVSLDCKQFLSIALSKGAEAALPDLKGVSFLISHEIINCSKKMYKMKRVQYYNKKGELLNDSINDEKKYRLPEFRPIPPDSVVENLADIVCK